MFSQAAANLRNVNLSSRSSMRAHLAGPRRDHTILQYTQGAQLRTGNLENPFAPSSGTCLGRLAVHCYTSQRQDPAELSEATRGLANLRCTSHKSWQSRSRQPFREARRQPLPCEFGRRRSPARPAASPIQRCKKITRMTRLPLRVLPGPSVARAMPCCSS